MWEGEGEEKGGEGDHGGREGEEKKKDRGRVEKEIIGGECKTSICQNPGIQFTAYNLDITN